ncbi:Aldehyde-alcohol dehydrogenase [Roseimaritima multifibrata]|uniref:Aldehyde-alcohol dehydrogenase n=1 Tax=Roseimaritima multifibrata TaxID=1930274 RepID=A0A517MGK6_9BACT|nr:phosphonoacetaldehyde reductase [Roseimaritima multifibrata]QDS94018.1 Aldehyde-alcohol dehydrogenase [Roseimaritima multifibrata]
MVLDPSSSIASASGPAESIDLVPGLVETRGCERLFLVLDEMAYQASGAKERLEPFFEKCETVRFVGFEPNPKLSDVRRGIEAYQAFRPDIVIAIGGGTAIDLAKLIATFAVEEAEPMQIIDREVSLQAKRVPLIAIPTTAGTGSEATHFAVVYVEGKKYSVADASLLPDIAVVDSRLTSSLPKSITAATGLDAFCQAVESIWSVGATEESMGYATEAVRLAAQHLVPASCGPSPDDRKAMSLASHLAGKAINLTKTTASHALSYHLTSMHGIPHGVAVALTLAPMLAFNAEVGEDDCSDPRGAEHVQKRIGLILELLGAVNVAEGCQRIQEILRDLDCPVSVADAGICSQDDLVAVVDSVNAERLSNNPRKATREDLLQVLTMDLCSDKI